VAFDYLSKSLATEPRRLLAGSWPHYAVLEVLRAGSDAWVLVRTDAQPDPITAIRWPLLRPDGSPNRLDVPGHHLEAFIQGGPMEEPQRERARMGTMQLIDGSDYF
jgi:hypothetical protein